MASFEQTDRQRKAFGSRIRQLRTQKGWTLAYLADRSGLAISTISKAERGVIALTYDRLALLAAGLDIEMSAFFAETGKNFAEGGFSVARGGGSHRQETPNYVYEVLFSGVWHKAMTPVISTLKSRELYEFEDYARHSGQEFLMVLEGQVTIHLEGRDPVHLATGDCAYFDSDLGHIYASEGSGDARILVVNSEG